jgi:osmotically-inducible protein OsmY
MKLLAVLTAGATALALLGLAGCNTFVAGTTVTAGAVTGDSRTAGTIVKEQDIEARAHDFFSADTELEQRCHLNIASFNLTVLLSGECQTEELRTRAVKYVERIDGIQKVHNEIQIQHPSTLLTRTNDSLITSRVKTKLFTIRNLRDGQIKVVTESGTVYLMGLVDETTGGAVAEVVANMRGVSKVVKVFEYPAAGAAVATR